jgi:phage tail-like protein
MSSTLRSFALLAGGDSWSRCAHRDTFLQLEGGVVELAWSDPPTPPPLPAALPTPAGLAFDAECRLYHSDPAAGVVERILWRAGSPYASPAPVELFVRDDPPVGGDFAPEAPLDGPLSGPRGLAVDVDDRLFVAETGARRILVHDLWSRRLLRVIPTPPGTRPLDLAVDGRTVYATLEGAAELMRFSARDDAEPLPLPPEAPAATRIAISPSGEIVVLAAAGTEDAFVVPYDHPRDAIFVPGATDIEWESDDTLVVARAPGESFLRYRLAAGSVEAILPLVAHGYDGAGIVRTPEGRIGFWTAGGFRSAVPARVLFTQRGTVTSYRLDSGEYQTAWGRIFLDACIPAGTSVHLSCVTTDEDFDEPELARTPPGNLVTLTVRRPDLSPPMPPLSLLPPEPDRHPLHRREAGRELAWVYPDAGDAFVTYEAPVLAEPGRYLWVTLELRGTRRVSPRVRDVRVEHPSHDYLRRIPKTFSRDPVDADFLRRYLALFDGLLNGLETRAAFREVLLDPFGTPEEMLPWLASFLGLTLDTRWPVQARRTLISEVAWLFRFRGTIPGLSRFLEIYLGEPVILLEHYRLRGMGGAILGESGPVQSRAVIGAGFRVGGAIGEPDESPLTGSVEDAFETHAHRFSVMIRGILSEEQLAVVRYILDVHRPAHTLFEICTLGAGMRVGRGLHVGISSTIGRTGSFRTLQLGAAALGRGGIVGRPDAGTSLEVARLGRGSRVG